MSEESEKQCAGLHELHEFWFEGYDGWGNEEMGKKWFAGGEEIDAVLCERFAGLAADAAQGKLDDCASDDRLASALVIALDQLPRNLHRGAAEAFACDGKSIALAQGLVADGRLASMWPCERLFVLMPYQHSEDIKVQEASVRLFQELSDSEPEGQAGFFEGTVKYAQLHHDIVARFGRFPHRNKALGRQMTDEESSWLEEGGETFGQ